MWRNTRYDLQDYTSLGIAAAETTWGYPITTSGESFIRNGSTWLVVGHSVAAQIYGSLYGSASRSSVNSVLDRMRACGVNCISISAVELFSLGQSGANAGYQVGIFDNGYLYSGVSTRTWAVGDLCYTVEGSNSRSNVYRCVSGGVGTGTTGPTGTSSGITVGGATWDYVRAANSAYSTAFFTGTYSSAGFDYFMHACGSRGIYVALRMGDWSTVFKGQNSGYPLAGGGNMSGYCGAWPLDGESSTPTYLTYMKNFFAQFFDRVNSISGRRYGDDPTLFAVDVLNENGVSFWYYNTTSTSSPTGNTFDLMCKTGSASPGVADRGSTIVAWWDAKWLAWYALNYPGHTPNGDYSGQGDTLPCYAYTGAMGSNVAARSTFRVPGTGTAPNDTLVEWRRRVAQFLGETERDMMISFKAYIRSKSPYALMIGGQYSWVGTLAAQIPDIQDRHFYDNPALTTDGNTQTVSGVMQAYSGGTTVNVDTIVGVNFAHTFAVGMPVRVTQVASPFNTAVYTMATVTASTGFTATAADPGWTGAATLILPNVSQNYCPWHQEPPGTNTASSTRTHLNLTSGTGEENYDVASYLGQSNFGGYFTLLSSHYSGQPCLTTEFGAKGLTDPHNKGIYRVAYTLCSLLQGESGSFQYLWPSFSEQPGTGEHFLPGDGCAMLSTQLIALMSRPGVISQFPVTNTTQVTESDVAGWYAAHNTTEGYAGASGSWPHFVQTLGAGGTNTDYSCFLHARLRAKIASTTKKTNASYTYSSTGQTFGGLTSITTGRLYHQRNIGYVTYESPKIVLIFGRIPATTTTTDMTNMKVTTIDGKYWYGLVCWISADGSDLGAGRSHLYTWMYPREEVQKFRAASMTSRTQAIYMLDGDYTGSTDATIQPGVVLRNGLEVQLTTPRQPCVYRLVKGRRDYYYAPRSGSTLYLQPHDPLLILE